MHHHPRTIAKSEHGKPIKRPLPRKPTSIKKLFMKPLARPLDRCKIVSFRRQIYGEMMLFTVSIFACLINPTPFGYTSGFKVAIINHFNGAKFLEKD